MFKEVFLSGTPYEKGFTYGSRCRAEVLRSIEDYSFLFQDRQGYSWEEAKTVARRFLPTLTGKYQPYAEEMRGIADGAGVTFDDILTLNCRTEVIYSAKETPRKAPDECTAFSALSCATEDGSTLAGQSWDYILAQREACVIVRFPAEGNIPARLMFLEAGMVGGKGAVYEEQVRKIVRGATLTKAETKALMESGPARKALSEISLSRNTDPVSKSTVPVWVRDMSIKMAQSVSPSVTESSIAGMFADAEAFPKVSDAPKVTAPAGTVEYARQTEALRRWQQAEEALHPTADPAQEGAVSAVTGKAAASPQEAATISIEGKSYTWDEFRDYVQRAIPTDLNKAPAVLNQIRQFFDLSVKNGTEIRNEVERMKAREGSNVSGEGLQGNSDQRSGEQDGRVAEETRRTEAAAERRTYTEGIKAKVRVSPKNANGKTYNAVDERDYHKIKGLTEAKRRIEADGGEMIAVIGGISTGYKRKDGTDALANGEFRGRTVVVQVDDPQYTPVQIGGHEGMHMRIANDPALLAFLTERFVTDEVRQLVHDNYDSENGPYFVNYGLMDEKNADDFFEELFCDLNGNLPGRIDGETLSGLRRRFNKVMKEYDQGRFNDENVERAVKDGESLSVPQPDLPRMSRATYENEQYKSRVTAGGVDESAAESKFSLTSGLGDDTIKRVSEALKMVDLGFTNSQIFAQTGLLRYNNGNLRDGIAGDIVWRNENDTGRILPARGNANAENDSLGSGARARTGEGRMVVLPEGHGAQQGSGRAPIQKVWEELARDNQRKITRAIRKGLTDEAKLIYDAETWAHKLYETYTESPVLLDQWSGYFTNFPEVARQVKDVVEAPDEGASSVSRYSLITVPAVPPSSDAWTRGFTAEDVRKIDGDFRKNDVQVEYVEDINPDEAARKEERIKLASRTAAGKRGNGTQRGNTQTTYEKLYDTFEHEGFAGTILDASSGLGLGTDAGIRRGFDVEDIEPYYGEGYKPMYSDYSRLDKQFDRIISSAVINVLTQDDADAMVSAIGKALAPGGKAYITVRSNTSVDGSLKGGDAIRLSQSAHEWYVPGSNNYQRGYETAELKAYLEDVLGPGYTVEASPSYWDKVSGKYKKWGDTSAVITKTESKFSIATVQGYGEMAVVDNEDAPRDAKAAELYLTAIAGSPEVFARTLDGNTEVYLGTDLPGEYTWSRDSRRAEYFEKQAKMKASTILKDMIYLGENGRWQENIKEKHAVDAKNGWTRFDVTFATPLRMGKNLSYRVYTGEALIRNDADGKSYLYDVVNVNYKETLPSDRVMLNRNDSYNTPAVLRDKTAPLNRDTVPQPGENVKSKFSMSPTLDSEADVVIAFDSAQVKSTANTDPTSKKDFRFSFTNSAQNDILSSTTEEGAAEDERGRPDYELGNRVLGSQTDNYPAGRGRADEKTVAGVFSLTDTARRTVGRTLARALGTNPAGDALLRNGGSLDRLIETVARLVTRHQSAGNAEIKMMLPGTTDADIRAIREAVTPGKHLLANEKMTQRDRDYLSAVKANPRAAERMLRDAAERAGYVKLAHHYTDADFTVFRFGEVGFHVGTVQQAAYRQSVTNPAEGRILDLYIRPGNSLYWTDVGLWNAEEMAGADPEGVGLDALTEEERSAFFDELRRIGEIKDTEASNRALIDFLKRQGYDSIRYENTQDRNDEDPVEESYLLFDPEQLKSADLITRDDAGNIIPLSQRFDSSKEDFRFSFANDVSVDPDLQDLVDQMAACDKLFGTSFTPAILNLMSASDKVFNVKAPTGVERVSNMARGQDWRDKTIGAAAGMDRGEWEKLLSYTAQTEKDSRNRATDLLYYTDATGRRVFLRDADPKAYQEVLDILRNTGWNAVKVDAAYMIWNEKMKDALNDSTKQADFVAWTKLIREKETEMGQGIQAVSKWKNTSPAVAFYHAWELINKNKKMTKQQKEALFQRILSHYERVQEATTSDALRNITMEIANERGVTSGIIFKGRDALMVRKAIRNAMSSMNTAELRNLATNSAMAMAADTRQLKAGEAMRTIQVLNMLSKPSTTMKNLVGNGSFYTIDFVSMNGAALLDLALSKITGTRSIAAERWSLFNKASRDGFMRSLAEVLLDVDMEVETNRYGLTTGRTFKQQGNIMERLLSAYERNMNFLLVTPDEFFKSAVRSTEKRVQKLVNDGKIKATDKDYAVKFADSLALYRTFQDNSVVAGMIQSIHDFANMIGFGDSGRKMGGRTVHSFGLGDLMAPFTKVAGNLVSRGIEYNPVNAIRGTVELVRVLNDARIAKTTGATVDPAKQAQALSDIARGLNGTLIAAAFLALVKAGLLRKARDDDDPNVLALNSAEGITSTQLNLDAVSRWLNGGDASWTKGDTLVDVNSIEPLNLLMDLGAEVAGWTPDMSAKDIAESILSSVASASAELPAVQGLLGVVEDVMVYGQDPVDAALNSVLNTVSSSFVPNIVRGYAKGTDQYVRNTYSSGTTLGNLVDYTKSGIPGLRETLPVSLDNFGREKEYAASPVGNFMNSMVNPLGINTYNQDDLTRELDKLREATGDPSFYPDKSAPSKISKGGEDIELTFEQKQTYQRSYGSEVYRQMAEMIRSEYYRDAADEARVALLKSCDSYAAALAKDSLLGVGLTTAQTNAKNAKGLYGINTCDFLSARYAVKDITANLKNSKGEGIDNSKSLLLMQTLYRSGIMDGMTKKQRQQFMSDLGVNKTTLGYNEKLVNGKLKALEKKYGFDLNTD